MEHGRAMNVQNHPGWTVVENKQVGSGRWHSYHEVVLQTPEQRGTKFGWSLLEIHGLTENQDQVSFRTDEDGNVEADLVEAVEEIVTVWLET